MNRKSSSIILYNELNSNLGSSSAKQRMEWASLIVDEDIELKELSCLLHLEYKIALRYSWLLSDIGMIKADELKSVLPYLFKLSSQITHIDFKKSFATYWLICGVPKENEAEAIELLFQWILSTKVNVTTKSRAIKVLTSLADTYPELKVELNACLEHQRNKYSKDFDKKITKALKEIHP